MKRLLGFFIFFIAVSTNIFSEIQLEGNFGYFFETNTYNNIERNLNGQSIGITARFFPIKTIGLFLGINSNMFKFSDSNEYIKEFISEGNDVELYKNSRDYIDINLGISLAHQITSRFGIQSDIGISNTIWYVESMTGKIHYNDSIYNFSSGIFQVTNGLSVIGDIFGYYQLGKKKKICLAIGIKCNLIFLRNEKIDIVIHTRSSYTNTETFSVFVFTPHIGIIKIF
jgi:hypothetical protein